MIEEPISKYLRFLRKECKEALAEEFKDKTIVSLSKNEAKKVATIFKALSNTIRLMIVWILIQNSMPVCLLSALLGVERSLISHHLKELKENNIVNEEAKGKFKYYYINPKVKDIIQELIVKTLKIQ